VAGRPRKRIWEFLCKCVLEHSPGSKYGQTPKAWVIPRLPEETKMLEQMTLLRTCRRPACRSSLNHRPAWLRAILEQNRDCDIFVLAAMAWIIARHFVGNFLPWTKECVPVILCITGPQGTGKTRTVRETLRRLDVHVEDLPASSCESKFAGIPAERLKAVYSKAAELQLKKGRPTAVVLDDLDLAVGDFGATGTSNIHHLLSALMEIADRPTVVDGRRLDRVPMIVTCNDITKVYPVATRERRMRIVSWIPTREELLPVAIRMFDGFLSESQVSGLLLPDASELQPPPPGEATGNVVTGNHSLTTLAQLGQLKAILLDEYIDAVCESLPDQPLHAILSGEVNPAPPAGPVSAEHLERAILGLRAERESRQDYTKF